MPVIGCRRDKGESGAMAVMVGIFVVVLFTCAAMSVDLGSAWARKRAVQRQVDVSAMSAGHLLPLTATNRFDIAAEVAHYLNENRIDGQGEITAAALLNGVDADGEVTFQDSHGGACVVGCTQMTVVAPQARVDFGMARVIGFSSTNVQRSASVRVVSALPPKNKIVPFWLPTGCGFGPAVADTTGGSNFALASTAPTLARVVQPQSAATAGLAPLPGVWVPPLAVGTHVLAGVSPITVPQGSTTTVSGYLISNLPNNTDRASIRFYSPDGSSYVDYATQSVGGGVLSVAAFQVGTEVTSIPGDWKVYALAVKNGNGALTVSVTSLIFRVTPPVDPGPSPSDTPTASPSATSVPVGCVGQDRGNFGQLDSPRKDGSSTQRRLGLNIALGLDHQLVPFTFDVGQPLDKDCGSSAKGFIDRAQADTVPLDGRNCILGDTGNDGPAIYDGFVAGVNGVPGRFDANVSPTTCPGRGNATIGGKLINNDVLSCFLRNGATLASISQSSGVTGAMLDPLVVESPRFVWLPVVVATDRAQKDFQPIFDFVPAFVTDETQTTAATDANGLDINGNSVQTLRVYTFNKDALPIDEQAYSVDYDVAVHQSIVRLVN
jgi:hypothetical protein